MLSEQSVSQTEFFIGETQLLACLSYETQYIEIQKMWTKLIKHILFAYIIYLYKSSYTCTEKHL